MKDGNKIVEPIILEIEDNRKFGHVAFFVDRDDFLKAIGEARKMLGINKLIPYKGVEPWTERELANTLRLLEQKPTSFPWGPLELIARKICMRFKCPDYMDIAIESAILSGKVTDREVEHTAYCRIIAPQEGYNFPMPWPEVAIIVTTHTTIQEIEKLFRTRVRELFKFRSDFFGELASDTISNIKRDRHWYWQHKHGMSYQKIWNAAPQNLPVGGRDVVIKAIKQYKERLAMEL